MCKVFTWRETLYVFLQKYHPWEPLLIPSISPILLLWKLRYRETFVPKTYAPRPTKELGIFTFVAPHTTLSCGSYPGTLSIIFPLAECVPSNENVGAVLLRVTCPFRFTAWGARPGTCQAFSLSLVSLFSTCKHWSHSTYRLTCLRSLLFESWGKRHQDRKY